MIASAPHDRSASDPTFAVNGIDATTGEYLPALSISELAVLARGDARDLGYLEEAARYGARRRAGTLELIDGRSESDLAEAGWGVIFAEGADPAVREALA